MNIELAQRAIACKGWRYLDGCKCLDDGKQHAMGPVFWRLVNGAWEPLGHSLRARSLDSFQGLPDFDDSATRGCLLELVREAWAQPTLHVRPEGNVWRVWTSEPGVWVYWTETDALIAALEAAPEKPCKPT